MSKRVVAYYRNVYGLIWQKEFDNAEDYLDWKRNDPELWNKENETYLELIKVTTHWLPLDWRCLN